MPGTLSSWGLGGCNVGGSQCPVPTALVMFKNHPVVGGENHPMLKEDLVMPSWPYRTPFSASFENP